MEELRKQLSVKDRAHLYELWEDLEKVKALKSMLSIRQDNLARWGVMSAPDFNYVMEKRGQISEDVWILKFLIHNHKESDKERRAKQK